MGFWDAFKEAYRRARDGGSSSSEAAAVKWVRRHLPSNHVTIGILLVIFGILQGTPLLIFGIAAGISVPLAWLSLGLGLLLFTWEARIPRLLRVFFYAWVLFFVIGLFDRIDRFLSHQPPARVGMPGVPLKVATPA